jgi:formamidopyrimidine-DNA glycosylase
MPELPEVEIVRRQLADYLEGKTIENVDVCAWKSVKRDRYFPRQVAGQTVTELNRVGKYVLFELDAPNVWLVCHLRMTGRLIFVPAEAGKQLGGGHSLADPPQSQPHEHTRIIFDFADGSKLFFNDMRKFGYIQRADKADIDAIKAKLGPEPRTREYTVSVLHDVLSGRKTPVKAALLKQKDIAGLGNIYVDEACWRAGVRPDRTAGKLSKKEVQHLYDATQSVLTDALAYGGTTFNDFVDTGGEAGNFSDRLAVFGRERKPCPRCERKIEKIRTAGRGTHVCPQCQE